ncbi:MAG: HlyD family type I secretion periplasmic adaptor subunit [Rhodospirillaceae bacterium]|jgi:membrane fusion protein, adhesin transport system|nr:HlyD family type I secretion periplasmic adaptor subunit [Rhodospirillaceae bacterium]MBT5032874.1 HlyD family type I secretion periplasmic adaptor subunit [Rhodospirillaceae bacterium]MBT6362000.1 HlyD family type I secretion periplasmic adaptor subunit [Rhodospirillaceae bacterium]MBT7487517.1 HlyD family type I secretion periplasmic adaptor subunit [Rhodospirillales bacterium]MBT8003808.1 HlyD family type I secretion periplasmic adaptor subunit [Rhodospirillales bacterium]
MLDQSPHDDIDFNKGPEIGKNPLDDLLIHHPIPSWRIVAWPVMIMLGLFLGWANFAELDEVAIATGEVIPQGKVKLIQHLEGGIIEEIFVKEGTVVKEGAPLVQLNLASSGVNREELVVRLDGQLLVRARLEAEANGKKLVFPKDVAARRPGQAAAQRRAYDARKREIASTVRVAQTQVSQRRSELEEVQSRARAITQNLKLANERLKLSKSLLEKGLIPKIEFLQLEAELENLKGDQKGLAPSLARARGAVNEANARIRETRERSKRESEEELVKTEQALGRIKELLTEATEQGSRSQIKSPIAGIVKNMRYNTIGGVVKPGEAIMEVVPTGGDLVVEAKLDPGDRAYVREGQRVVVKLSAYDYARYGGLEGIVNNVAPDSNTNEEGKPYFPITIKPEKVYLGDRPGDFPVMPGMQATVDIHTGSRSVMEFLIRPVLKLRAEAFRER